MDALTRFLTSKRTTLLAVTSGVALLFFDASFVSLLAELGIGAAVTAKLVALAKLSTLVLASLGYSPLTRPAAE
jgi:hypothetical protein